MVPQANAAEGAKPGASVFQENPAQSDPAQELQRLRNEGIAKYESGIALDDAMKAFERAYGKSQQAADAFNVAVVYFKKNDAANAKKWLGLALQADPNFPNAHYLSGSLARTEGDNAAAKTSWEKARELAPDDGYTYYQLALLAQAEHKDQEFLQSLVKALGLEPDNAAALYQMYRYYQTSGNKELAEQTLAKFNALKNQEKFSRREKQKDPGKLAQPVLPTNTGGFAALEVQPTFAITEAKPGCKALAADHYTVLDNGAASEALALACADGKLLRTDPSKPEGFLPLGKLPAGTRDIRLEWFDEKGPRGLALGKTGLSLDKNLAGEEGGDYGKLLAGVAAPVALADLDSDGDVDIVFGGNKTPLTNAGKLQFVQENALYKTSPLPGQLDKAKAVAVADMQRDGLPDLLILRNDALVVVVGSPSGHKEAVRLPVPATAQGVVAGDFSNDGKLDVAVLLPDAVRFIWNLDVRAEAKSAVTQNVKLGFGGAKLAKAMDYNNDGLLDLLALAADGQAAILRNQGGRGFTVQNPSPPAPLPAGERGATAPLPQATAPLASGREKRGAGVGERGHWPKPAANGRLLAVDFDKDGLEDLAYVTSDGSLALARNATAGAGHSIALFANGVRAAPSGLMTQLEIRRGGDYAYRQSQGGVQHIGIGQSSYVEILRLEWTNGFIENKLKIDAKPIPYIFKESERISGSCPSLFVWNGEKFEYLTDTFISGPMGVPFDRGVYFPVRDREFLAIPADKAKLRDGKLDIRFTEELHESVFIDRASLKIVDHPIGTEIFPHSRLAPPDANGPPVEAFYTAGNLVAPARAQGSDGSDLTETLANTDKVYADYFARTQNPGFAESHWVDLDLPESVDPASVDALLATGWFFYFESTSMIAQAQSNGPQLPWPTLQQFVDGAWQAIGVVGIPTGKGKTAVMPLQGGLKSRHLRISSGISLYWDRIAFSLNNGTSPAQTQDAPLAEAKLRFHGFSALASRNPELFDYHQVSYSALWNPLQGRYTDYGPVDSLINQADGQYALFGSGDEIALSFQINQAEPPPGMTRSYLLEFVGYVKDGDRYTAHAGSVEPMPYLGLDQYPPPEDGRLQQAQTVSPRRNRTPLDFTLSQSPSGSGQEQ
jgi:tetratricopeptide (TPR) repeat protein